MAFARQLPGSCRTSWLFFKSYLLAWRLNKQQASGAFLSRDSFWLANRLEPVVIKGQSEQIAIAPNLASRRPFHQGQTLEKPVVCVC
jgi:hypothetical protein